MAFSDELKKDNLKVIFVEINYKDSDLVPGTTYFSDYIIDLPEGLTDGGDLFPAVPRLKNIPFFARTVDYIDNDIVKGSYSIKIENTDNAYTSFFKDNYFKNESIKFYVTIDGLNPFDKLQLAEGTIREIKINEKDIQLKIDEINLYQKNSPIETFDYADQDPDLEGEYKPQLLGTVKDYKVSDFNLNIAPEDEFKTLTGATVDASVTNLALDNFIYFTDATAIEILRDNIKEKDQIKFQGITYTVENFFPVDEDGESFNLRIEVDKIPVVSSDGDIEIKVENGDASFNFNNKYFVSTTTQPSARIYEKTLITRNFTNAVGFKEYIEIGEDWSFLEEGDVVFFAKFSSGDIISTPNTTEEMVVDYFDSANNRIYVKDYCPVLLNRFVADNWYVCFDKVQKIKINDKQEYQKLRNLISLDFAGKDGSNFLTSSTISATAIFNGIKFTADTAGYNGNGTEFFFQQKNNNTGVNGNESNIIISRVTSVTNVYGSGKVRWIIDFSPASNSQDVIDALDAYDLANPGQIDFSYTKLRDENPLLETISDVQQADKYIVSTPVMLEGGKTEKSFIYFNYDTEDDALVGETPKKVCIYWNVDGDTTAPTPLGVSSNTDYIDVDILSTDNLATVLLKTSSAILASAIYGNTPLLAGYTLGDTKLYFKSTKHIKYPLFLTRNSNNFPADVNIIHSLVNFWDTSTENNEIVLNLDKKAYNTAFKYYIKPDPNNNVLLSSIDRLPNARLNILSDVFSLTNFDNLKKQILYNNTPQGLKEELEGGTILFKNSSYLGKEYCNKILKIKDDTFFINNELELFTAYSGRFYVELFKPLDIEDVTIDFKSKSLSGEICEKLFDYYGITKFNSSDITTLNNNHPEFQTGLIINENIKLYEALKMITESFNLYTYIDKLGDIRVKFFNPFDTTTPTEIDFNSVISISEEINSIKYSKYDLFINKKQESGSSTKKELVNEFTTQLSIETNWEDIKDLNSIIMRDFLTDTFDSRTYAELLGSKYLSKVEEIEIVGSLKLLDFELGDLINISNYDKLDSANSYKISNIETNGDNVKINAIRIIENPDVVFRIVDENGNFLIDEAENFILGT